MRFFFILLSLSATSLALCVDTKSPDNSIQKLKEGNARYINNQTIHPDQGADRRENTIGKQNPFAVIVGCSDSRVPPEIIFDQGLGDLFVVRVAGNIVGPVELDSIEYAADGLQTPLIMVLGHENCGAVTAVLENQNITEEIENIAPYIKPAIEESKNMPGDRLTNAIKTNVKLVVEHLKTTPVIKRLIKEKKIKIIGGFYVLSDGHVETIVQ